MKQNVVICVYQEKRYDHTESIVNYELEYIQRLLIRRGTGNKKLCKAFVFGDGQTCCMDFPETDPERIYHVEIAKRVPSLAHMWNMGLALLERQHQKDNQTGRLANNYLYLITNTYFPREETLRIIAGGERFSDLDFTPVLVKNERQNMGILEDYISLKLQGQVFYMNERRELVELLMR